MLEGTKNQMIVTNEKVVTDLLPKKTLRFSIYFLLFTFEFLIYLIFVFLLNFLKEKYEIRYPNLNH